MSLDAIDWHAPWLAPFTMPGRQAAQRATAGEPLADVLNAHAAPGALPVRFVPQSALPPGIAYEQFIHATGQVPTRDNLHDSFNALVWLRFPQAKQRLNALHAQAIAAQGIGATRGPLRDAATLLDETGPCCWRPRRCGRRCARADGAGCLWSCVRCRHQARLVVFGHALLEQLVHPRKPLTAHVYQAQAAPDSVADLDTWLAADLDAAHLAAKPFTPLPVLGIPGWWPENENFSFYDDSLVFRSARPKPQEPRNRPRPRCPPRRLKRGALAVDSIRCPLPRRRLFAFPCGVPSMKRIALLYSTNLAVVVVLGIVASLLGVNRYSHSQRPEPGRACWALPW